MQHDVAFCVVLLHTADEWLLLLCCTSIINPSIVIKEHTKNCVLSRRCLTLFLFTRKNSWTPFTKGGYKGGYSTPKKNMTPFEKSIKKTPS